ncbi:MAG: hypothetical protein EBS18_02975 [Actinobacteria bacterium]|nr:hypothetical protein [Actinomycetota bacterium]
MRYIYSLIFGAFLGFAATILHNAWQPIGFVLALLLTYLGIKLLGVKYYFRRFKVVASLAWLLVVIRAGTPGLGDELLIYGNTYGNVFLLFGFVVAFIAVVTPNSASSNFARRDYL